MADLQAESSSFRTVEEYARHAGPGQLPVHASRIVHRVSSLPPSSLHCTKSLARLTRIPAPRLSLSFSPPDPKDDSVTLRFRFPGATDLRRKVPSSFSVVSQPAEYLLRRMEKFLSPSLPLIHGSRVVFGRLRLSHPSPNTNRPNENCLSTRHRRIHHRSG